MAILETEVVVLGSGPGGYTAAFRSADLGKKVILIERFPSIGGVCLNVGCIPSKALLHMAKVIQESKVAKEHGIDFGKPKIDIAKIRSFKDGVVGKLTGGLKALAKGRSVQIVQGIGSFSSPFEIEVEPTLGSTLTEKTTIKFQHCIIAVGSAVTKIPGIPYEDSRIMDSTGALELKSIPKRLLVVGGGIIGLEMATVYNSLGSEITVAEFTDGIMPGCDRDLVKPLQTRLEKHGFQFLVKTKVKQIEAKKDGLHASFETVEGTKLPAQVFDKALVSVGRSPNGAKIQADKAGVNVTDRGFIPVDAQQRTNVAHIFAIGDVVGQPMLAHKATHEAKVAAEVISGHKSVFDAITIPSVAYTDPEVAWAGLTETEAKVKNIPYEKASFPWVASGRALSMARSEGLTKVLYDKDTKKLLGVGIVGSSAGDLIAESVLAIEMGADLEDISLTIHPHPTLSETVAMASELGEGTITDLMNTKK